MGEGPGQARWLQTSSRGRPRVASAVAKLKKKKGFYKSEV